MTRQPPRFTLSERLQIGAIALLGWAVVWTLGSTVRFRQVGRERVDRFHEAGQSMIFTFWHNQILPATYLFRHNGVAVMTSRHFDGEYIARIIRRFGYTSVRGSSTRGGARALLELRRFIAAGGHVAFTIDGPWGPRYRVKPGPILLAIKTGAPIIPFHIEPASFWELRSWDAFRIPKPFTRAVVKFGRPIFLSEDEDSEALESLQREMERVREIAQRLVAEEMQGPGRAGVGRD